MVNTNTLEVILFFFRTLYARYRANNNFQIIFRVPTWDQLQKVIHNSQVIQSDIGTVNIVD